jgi:membrane protein YdbS with pleckstrin-like domain
MNAKSQRPILRSEKIQSTSFLIWILSGMYLLPMVWLLLSTSYGAHETKAWVMPAVAALTVSYAIFMLLLWPNEKSRRGQPHKPSRHPYAD